jgi:protein phosphatase PTC2/3
MVRWLASASRSLIPIYVGNLALSRAIGDFEFKKNYALAPERQIITADPDIIMHQLTDEDEFLVLACDGTPVSSHYIPPLIIWPIGIWDCLSSQQVIDSVRRLIHDGMELTEICESLIDLCLAPPPPSTTGIGSDNMTVVVIALLNGRSKEEWYAWVKDRVIQQYGYDTPVSLPQVFSPVRRTAGAQSNLDRPNGAGIRIPAGGLGGLARALANGPISFHPGANENEDNTLEFERYDSDEDESDEEIGATSSFLNSLRRSKEDVTKFLLAQLEEERDGMNHGLDAGGSSHQFEPDGDMDANESDEEGAEESSAIQRNLAEVENQNLQQGEAPLPPLDSKSNEEQPQLVPQLPSGDAPSGAVKVEGLMDTSESPFKMG